MSPMRRNHSGLYLQEKKLVEDYRRLHVKDIAVDGVPAVDETVGDMICHTGNWLEVLRSLTSKRQCRKNCLRVPEDIYTQ